MLSTAHRYVLSVAETGSIRSSSQRLNVAASAISRQIQLVEHQFGYPLFERFASGMVLTHEGQILVRHLRHTAREVELAQAEMNALHGLVTGTIRFAAIEGVLTSWLIPAMAAFRAQHPGVTFEGQILGSQAAYDLVMVDRLDFGVVVYTDEWPGIEIRKRYDTPLLAAMHPDHPLAGHPAISLELLAREPLIMLDRSYATRTAFDRLIANAGLTSVVAFDVNHIEIAKRYVLETKGMTILPEYAVSMEVTDGSMVTRPLTTGQAVLDTVLFTRKSATHNKATDSFLRALMLAATDF
ncbi:LysR family transcriptional regulator [Phaeobacter gallaeciensis]|jgi:DNA-binding transcriptional LysR family regulator|uniref:LysR family transcriptional regulator n=1 Tax=Rhodobacterales TaxID=204455 RepID=UPI00237F4DFA|nr:LysR family transcriptional regulator [Phaeobacter gallaeciensis]MDE4193205.1 LysR family transcriptional regulator [Phaeobacter gallaeciensis]MDE4201520.1 LysR family transcriptional regulator [Phaeobacter gallaeciensis]MDE4205702.1 LysR family transcriptional regulator [Phaeobacter gallaeciensis]MDE4209843.1 LysR family transcriptional regulator [Phaeobacter gallaeciensis]MDE4218211.1 LysR family transcriptional regulator [Phaeobacter gallaeciensis]